VIKITVEAALNAELEEHLGYALYKHYYGVFWGHFGIGGMLSGKSIKTETINSPQSELSTNPASKFNIKPLGLR
jgi:hypothetical protein